MGDTRYSYEGNCWENINISPNTYKSEYFNLEIELESDTCYEMRKYNNIIPYRLNQSTKKELEKIKIFFEDHKDTFFFLFDKEELIGSILILRNYIQSLTIAKKYQRNGYGILLTKFAINYILTKGYTSVELNVLDGNIPAHNLYRKLSFKIVK